MDHPGTKSFKTRKQNEWGLFLLGDKKLKEQNNNKALDAFPGTTESIKLGTDPADHDRSGIVKDILLHKVQVL